VLKSQKQSPEQAEAIKVAETAETTQAMTYKVTMDDARRRNMRYAIWVTIAGIILMVVWTILVQEINPSVVSILENSSA
jgi:type IV secretory pathway component VirB8